MELFGLSPLLITGIILAAGFICFAIGGATPNYTDLDQKVWNLPHTKEHLGMIRDNVRAWRWARAWTVASTVVVLLGVSMLALLLEEAGGTILALIAWLITLLGSVCWIVGIAFQMGVEPLVAEKMGKKSTMLEWFSAVESWSILLLSFWITLGYLGLVFIGLAVIQTGLLPVWLGGVLSLLGLAGGVAMIINKPVYPETNFSVAAVPAWLYVLYLLLGIVTIFNP
jgi:hypothetical protein